MSLQRKVFYLIQDENREDTLGICHTKSEALERIPKMEKKVFQQARQWNIKRGFPAEQAEIFHLIPVRVTENQLIEAMSGGRR